MKWLLIPILWLLAVGLAVLTIWRLWRGKPILLRGRWSLQVIRMVAVVLVILGVGADKTSAAKPGGNGPAPGNPEASPEPAPPFSPPAVTKWTELTGRYSPWITFKQRLTQARLVGEVPAHARGTTSAFLRGLPPHLGKILSAEYRAALENKVAPAVSLADLQSALAEAEKEGYFDPWLTAYLWRQSGRSEGDARARIELYRRLSEHVCMTNALIKALPKGQKAIVAGPMAWRSKAGGRPGQVLGFQTDPKAVLQAANSLFTPGEQGTWMRDGMAALTADRDSGAGTLHHGNRKRTLEAGSAFRFHRLDLVQAGDKPLILQHGDYGKLEVPGGKLVSVWDLSSYLSEVGRQKVERDVDEAMKGDEQVALRLEKALPLVHRRLREQLAARPNAIGAARLRLILALFDDVVMPTPQPPQPAKVNAPAARGR